MELFDEGGPVDLWWTLAGGMQWTLEQQKSAASLHYLRFPAGSPLATGT